MAQPMKTVTQFSLAAPFSSEYSLKSCVSYLDLRFVLTLTYKHMRSARITVQATACLVAFTLLYINVFKLNASGSWTTIESVPLPNP